MPTIIISHPPRTLSVLNLVRGPDKICFANHRSWIVWVLLHKNIKRQDFSRVFVHEIYVYMDSILMLLLLSLFINLLLLLFDTSSQKDIKQQPTSTLINPNEAQRRLILGAGGDGGCSGIFHILIYDIFWAFSAVFGGSRFFFHPRSAGSSAF